MLTIYNNRLTLILPAFNKVFKKVMFEILYSFHDYKIMFYPMQFGFLSKPSTIDAVAGISKQMSQGSIDTFTCILFELHKAIDSINHENLLSKLENYSVEGKCLNWFGSFSNERYQCFPLNDVLSELLYLLVVKLQGSIFWLQLFLIYIKDLPGACEVPNSISCADDTIFLFVHRKNQDELHLLNKF